ncbi:MAG: response regulator [Flavobacteriales bacterium]|nr:response regulator [Flavobacteriales bacterium]MDG1767346.1 response regulator [Flavobacteriales bacterium]
MKKIDLACIIDDDSIHVFGAKRAISLANFCNQVLVFNNGKDAFDRISQIFALGKGIPELILLDINMPVWDGWDFLDEFLKLPESNNVRIFIMTSSVDPVDRTKAQTYKQVSNFIIKPITPEKLQVALQSESPR